MKGTMGAGNPTIWLSPGINPETEPNNRIHEKTSRKPNHEPKAGTQMKFSRIYNPFGSAHIASRISCCTTPRIADLQSIAYHISAHCFNRKVTCALALLYCHNVIHRSLVGAIIHRIVACRNVARPLCIVTTRSPDRRSHISHRNSFIPAV